MKNVPFVFELRDLWPESIRAVGIMQQSRALDILGKLELFLYRKADLIISVTNTYRDKLVKRGIDPNKIRIVTNGVDLDRFKWQAKDRQLVAALGLEDKFVVGYIGTHGLAHALETILEAASKLQEEGRNRFRFLLLGSGARKSFLVEEARRLGLSNVIFLDTVSRDEVTRYWSLLDASIIHLRHSELFRSVIPSKLFECMGMGIPVLYGIEGESASIVEREGVGLLFKPESASDLCRQLSAIEKDRSLRAVLRQAGLSAAPNYDRSKLALRMLEYLKELVS
jgi:glycosyltransferase involved in cell wall biosynthesis